MISKQLQRMYRGPENAFNSMDFSGRGYILEEDLLNKYFLLRCRLSLEDAQLASKMFNMFNGKEVKRDVPPNGMAFDTFKKNFFPHLCIVAEDNQSDGEKAAKRTKEQLLSNAGQQPQLIEERIKKLEKVLKLKLSMTYVSVREAFLHLDSDYDGFIQVEDILRHFKPEDGIDFYDLKKLMQDKDSKHVGKIGYTDFSRWLGGCIHQSSGFYFRLDSIKNPDFESAEMRHAKKFNKEDMQAIIASNLGNHEELETKVMEKMKFTWSRIRKAFANLDLDKSGFISKENLQLYFSSWGLTKEQFDWLYDKFDRDKDGKISYNDFTQTIGSELFPAEELYFRQAKQQNERFNPCKHPSCW